MSNNDLRAHDCARCYWSSQCEDYAITHCDDFTPVDDESDIRFYIDDCGERQEEYNSFIAEF